MSLSQTNAQDFPSYLNSLGMLEINISLLYQAIAEKTVDSTAKRHLLKISKDSAEHSKLLKGVANFVKIPQETTKPSDKKEAEATARTEKLRLEVQAVKRFKDDEFSQLFEELVSLENVLGEEYQSLAEISLPVSLQEMVSSMSIDEVQHQQLLATVRFIVSPNKAEHRGDTPIVKYTNPDNWRG